MINMTYLHNIETPSGVYSGSAPNTDETAERGHVMLNTYRLYTLDGRKTHLTISSVSRRIAKLCLMTAGLNYKLEIPYL